MTNFDILNTATAYYLPKLERARQLLSMLSEAYFADVTLDVVMHGLHEAQRGDAIWRHIIRKNERDQAEALLGRLIDRLAEPDYDEPSTTNRFRTFIVMEHPIHNRNREIVRLHVEERLTLTAIAPRFGITPERVRQIVRHARVDPIITREIAAKVMANKLRGSRTVRESRHCKVCGTVFSVVPSSGRSRCENHLYGQLTRKELIDYLKKLAGKIGRTPNQKDIIKADGPSHTVFYPAFGSLMKAQEAASLVPNSWGGSPGSPGRPRRPFWSLVGKGAANQCWPWLGYINERRGGYGLYCGKQAHRVAYTLHHGIELWNGHPCIYHTCDNPACCNPMHLWVGSNRQNMEEEKA